MTETRSSSIQKVSSGKILSINLTNGLHLLADCVAGSVDFSQELFSCPNCYLALNDFLEITPSSAKTTSQERHLVDQKRPAFYSAFYI